jgi:carboxypeptidase PM20D1
VINDKRVNYQVIACVEPTAVSPIDSLGFKLIEHTTLQIFPNVAPVPSLMIALSDSRFYANLTTSIYKFLPVMLRMKDVPRYHGIDERISIQSYEQLINFFYVLIENSDNAHLDLDFYKNDEL